MFCGERERTILGWGDEPHWGAPPLLGWGARWVAMPTVPVRAGGLASPGSGLHLSSVFLTSFSPGRPCLQDPRAALCLIGLCTKLGLCVPQPLRPHHCQRDGWGGAHHDLKLGSLRFPPALGTPGRGLIAGGERPFLPVGCSERVSPCARS